MQIAPHECAVSKQKSHAAGKAERRGNSKRIDHLLLWIRDQSERQAALFVKSLLRQCGVNADPERLHTELFEDVIVITQAAGLQGAPRSARSWIKVNQRPTLARSLGQIDRDAILVRTADARNLLANLQWRPGGGRSKPTAENRLHRGKITPKNAFVCIMSIKN